MLSFKRESTWLSTVTYTPDVGGPANLIGYTITSAIRTSDRKSYDFTVVLAPDGLSFTVSATSADTAKYSIGQADWDIRFLKDSVSYTETLSILIVQQITV